MEESAKSELMKGLYEMGAIKFGEFKLKSGQSSPIYVDLRSIISRPKLMKRLSDVICGVLEGRKLDRLCGVPYGALAIANVVSVASGVPGVLCRAEAKVHGTRKRVEGEYDPGHVCLIIEDVATTGSSILDTANVLREHGMAVNEALVVLDRGQGARQNLAEHGIALTSLVELSDLLNGLPDGVDESMRAKLAEYLAGDAPAAPPSSWALSARRTVLRHPVAKRLIDIAAKKQSNVCLAADLTKAGDILRLVRQVGSRICALKLHADIIQDFSLDFASELSRMSSEKELDFVIIEDRKFSDTGSTVAGQMGGVHRIGQWAHMVTVHGVSGPAVLQGLATVCAEKGIGCLLVGQMSSQGNLIDQHYQKGVLSMAYEFPNLVAGFICQKRFTEDPGFVYLSPGVNVSASGDGLSQQWRSPDTAVRTDLVDVVIVGRGVTASSDPSLTLQQYATAAWAPMAERN